ncbi:hypothetical protein Tco_0448227 [Tanacetum coccineum]
MVHAHLVVNAQGYNEYCWLLRRLPHRLQAATKVAGCYKSCQIGCRLRRLPHRLKAAAKRLKAAAKAAIKVANVNATTKVVGCCKGCYKGCRLLRRLPHKYQFAAKAAIEVVGCCNAAKKASTLLRRLHRGYGLDLLLKTNPTQASIKVTKPSFPKQSITKAAPFKPDKGNLTEVWEVVAEIMVTVMEIMPIDQVLRGFEPGSGSEVKGHSKGPFKGPSMGPSKLGEGSSKLNRGRRRRHRPLGEYIITLYTNGKLRTKVMMASDSQEASFLIKYHRGGVFVRDPLSYDYEILSEIPNVDLVSLGLAGFISLLETEFTSSVKSLFYLVHGLDFHLGLKPLKCEADFKECVECGVNNDHVLHVYASHSEFDLNETTTEQNDNSGSDLEDDDYNVYDYCSSEESDTASVDHLSDDEEEVLDVRTKKRDPAPKKKASKMFDESFLTSIFNGLPRDDFDNSSDPKTDDQDKLGDHWPIHDPKIKWKLIRPHLGERYEGPEQLKRALTYYALANGYKLYFEVNNPRRLVAKCSKDNQEKKCPFRLWASWMQEEKSFQIKNMIDEHVCSRTYEYGSLITSNWIARNYAKKIMINPSIKVKDIVALVLKKYKCKVSVSQARRGKIKALQQYQTCLEDHYGMLWSYAAEILNSNEGSTCKVGVDVMPDGKAYFSCFYVCFKAVKEGWLEGCRRVIGLDGCFLKTLCKGELLSAVGRDGNNQIYPIAWAVVSVENKENWSWFMQCLIDDLGIVDGEGLTIISDQHKGIIEAAKDVMPLAEHRQCARHIYANFRKRFTGVQFRSLFWQAAKATYPAKFEKIMQEIKDLSIEAHKHLMERNPESWSRAFFRTDRVCVAVENGISECFNSLIVEARRKPIINMLEDIRIGLMERMQRMREKHAKWADGICPNIRKKNWRVVPSGESRFEVRNGYEGFKVDERLRTCTCRGWQLTGIPCQHGLAALYFLYREPKEYVSEWYRKDKFVSAYSNYIEGLNGLD